VVCPYKRGKITRRHPPSAFWPVPQPLPTGYTNHQLKTLQNPLSAGDAFDVDVC